MTLLALLVLLIFLSAFLSGSETSLFSLSSTTLKTFKNSSDRRKTLVAHLMERPRDLLVAILILNVLCNLLIQNTVSAFFESFNTWTLKVGLPLALTLILGEVLPKSIALPLNTSMAPRVAVPLFWASSILGPIQRPLTKVTYWISRVLFGFLPKEEEMSEGELRLMLTFSKTSGALLPQECDLIGGTLDLQHSSVKERMRPREEILYYDLQDPISDLQRLLIDQEATRVPVCDGDLEKIIGIISTQQMFFYRDRIKTGKDLMPLLKKPLFVPETTRAWTLFKNLREKKESVAIVVDEYGSISGLIAQEDLIEAVVGEISDKRDLKSLYTRSGDVIICSGKLELAQFEDIFKIPLTSEESVVTLGGWLIEQLGDIPVAGAKYATKDFLFYVLAADPNRIRRIYVRRIRS